MNNYLKAHGQLSVGLVLFLLAAPISAQPGAVVHSVSLHSDKIALSGFVQLSLALEGPAPLRVELPTEAEKLLTPQSAAVWLIRPIGSATVKAIEGGRERWEQSFRLSPFIPGEKVAIAFAPLKVRTGSELNVHEVTFPTKEVRVQRTIAEAKGENARPVTGIEELPTIAPSQPDATGWPFIAALGAIFATVLIVVLIRKARTKPVPPPPGEWAERELDRLERDRALERIDALAAADRLAAILREFIERRHGLAATKLTTSELLIACERAAWPAERGAMLRAMLERCDRAKFAGDAPDAFEMMALVIRSREWVVAERPSVATGGL